MSSILVFCDIRDPDRRMRALVRIQAWGGKRLSEVCHLVELNGNQKGIYEALRQFASGSEDSLWVATLAEPPIGHVMTELVHDAGAASRRTPRGSMP
jgi:hypothetical protein